METGQVQFKQMTCRYYGETEVEVTKLQDRISTHEETYQNHVGFYCRVNAHHVKEYLEIVHEDKLSFGKQS